MTLKASLAKPIGVLLINTGTPDGTGYFQVRRYLRQFLSDRRVLDIFPLARFLLLEFAILPLRSKRSGDAYKKIWTSKGSPLLTNSHLMRARIQEKLGGHYKVVLAMRYGHPSLAEAWEKLKDCSELILFPLYPHYAASSTASALAEATRIMGDRSWNMPMLRTIGPFYENEGFIRAFTERIRSEGSKYTWDHLVFSFHGLPQHHIEKSGCAGACSERSCTVDATTTLCYRAQCFETARTLAKTLRLEEEKYSIGFQSRLGSRPWIKPYFDLLLPDLRKRGIERIAVVCPSFVADCLETLEEIRIRARETWLQLGGQDLVLIPCLNDSDLWVQAAVNLITQKPEA